MLTDELTNNIPIQRIGIYYTDERMNLKIQSRYLII